MANNPLLALAVETPDIAGSYQAGQQEGATRRTARLSSLIQQYQLKKAQAADVQSGRLAQLYQEIGPGLASGDEGALSKLAEVDPSAAIETRTRVQTQKSGDIKLWREQLDYIGGAAQSVLNAPAEFRPMLYSRAIADAKRRGIDVSSAPQEYSDAAVRQIAEQTLTAKEQIDLHQKGLDRTEKTRLESPEYKGSVARAEAEARLPSQLQVANARRTPGLSISLPDGTEISQGDVGGRLRPTTMGKIEDARLGASQRLAALDRVGQSFKPEYLQLGTRAGMTWGSLKARFGTLPEGERKQLTEFAAFKADTTENLNTTIRESTGTALSPGEAQRIGATVPVSGTGIFDGDDPVSFKAKLDRSTESVQMAIIRENIWRSQGMQGKPWEAMPLDSVKGFVNKRGDAIAAELKKADPNISAAAIGAEVKERLRREIGYQ